MVLQKKLIRKSAQALLAGVLIATSLWGCIESNTVAAPIDNEGQPVTASEVQESIRVLDIEPTRFSMVTESKVREWIGEASTSSGLLHVDVDQMTLAEFIGKNVDLIESYDLIYIGSYDGPNYMSGKLNTDEKSDGPFYNDEDLNGLIYSDVGDVVKLSDELAAQVIDEADSKGDLRYSGRDITESKSEEILEYINAGYPVVISSDLYNGQEISKQKVKETSNMYELLASCTGEHAKENVLRENTNPTGLKDMAYIPKMELSMISAPKEYEVRYKQDDSTVIEEISALEKEKDEENYSLEYIFEFTDNARAGDSTYTYDIQLFIDTNANGKFETTEEMYDLQLFDANGRPYDITAAQPGVRYKVIKELSSDYEGYIPWMLKVVSVDEDGNEMYFKCSTTGQCYIRPADVIEINALQIATSSGGNDLSRNETVQNLLKDLNSNGKHNYKVNITTITQEDYILAAANAEQSSYAGFYKDYFNVYDMLIIGFADGYADLCKDVSSDAYDVLFKCMKAIELFTESGRAVLFSNDTASYNKENDWTQELSEIVKESAGMDGLNNMFLDANAQIDENGPYKYRSLYFGGADAGETTRFISQVNKGQITSYPYDLNIIDGNGSLGLGDISKDWPTWAQIIINSLPDFRVISLGTLPIEPTTAQPYQLNREAMEEGVNVWYCLSDGFLGINALDDSAYASMANDVRNNYYIYSKDNITFTGMGCSENMNEYEAKLFVNTLIAAYNLGVKNPTVSIVADPADKDSELDYIYRMYDETTGEYLGEGEDILIDFYVEDTNIINGSKEIEIWYYFKRNHVYDDGEDIGTPIVFSPDDSTIGGGGVLEAFYELKLDSEWIDGLLNGAKEVEIFVEVKTNLTYTQGEGVNQEIVSIAETDKVYDSVIIKKVGLFDLD